MLYTTVTLFIEKCKIFPKGGDGTKFSHRFYVSQRSRFSLVSSSDVECSLSLWNCAYEGCVGGNGAVPKTRVKTLTSANNNNTKFRADVDHSLDRTQTHPSSYFFRFMPRHVEKKMCRPTTDHPLMMMMMLASLPLPFLVSLQI